MFLDEIEQFLRRKLVKLEKTTKIELHPVDQDSLNPSVKVYIENAKYIGFIGFWKSKTGEIGLSNLETQEDDFYYAFCVENNSEAEEHAQKVLSFFEIVEAWR